MPNWKRLGKGQGYWFKSVKAINQYWQHYLMKHFKVGMYLNRLQPEKGTISKRSRE